MEAFESYGEWAPEGWTSSVSQDVAAQIAERLAEPDYWCLVAERARTSVASVRATSVVGSWCRDASLDCGDEGGEELWLYECGAVDPAPQPAGARSILT